MKTLSQGSNIHELIHMHLAGEVGQSVEVLHLITNDILPSMMMIVDPIPKHLQLLWQSAQSFLHRVTDVRALECAVSSPSLRYAGTFDCIARLVAVRIDIVAFAHKQQ